MREDQLFPDLRPEDFIRVECPNCGGMTSHPKDSDTRLAHCQLCGSDMSPPEDSDGWQGTSRCRRFIWTPSHRRRRCVLDEGHPGTAEDRHDFSLPTIEHATEWEQDERERARHEHPSAAPRTDDELKADHDPRTNHEVLRRIGLRHGSPVLAEYEQENDA